MLDIDYFLEKAFKLRDLSFDFVQTHQNEESLRKLTKSQMSHFSTLLKMLLSFGIRKKLQKNPANLELVDTKGNDMRSERYLLEEAHKPVDLIQLEFAKLCLSMPILEKKFVGFAILNNKIKEAKQSED